MDGTGGSKRGFKKNRLTRMDDPKRILVIQLKRAGDVIITTPVLEMLRQRFPRAQIDFLVDPHFSVVLEHNPYLNAILCFDRRRPWRTYLQVRKNRYDWVVDFQSSPRSVPLALFSGAPVKAGYKVKFWGGFFTHAMRRPGRELMSEGKGALLRTISDFPPGHPDRRIFLTEKDREGAAALFPAGFAKPWIGFVPPHRHSSRRWPGKHFAALAVQLEKEGYPVAFFCGPGERSYVDEIRASIPRTKNVFVIEPDTLRDFAAALEHCCLVVSNDNGPMHLAIAVGKPTVVIFGPTSPTAVLPPNGRHRALRLEGLSCLECNLNVCPFNHECMELLPPARVFDACREMLAAAG
jgi:heptosyltransferase III